MIQSSLSIRGISSFTARPAGLPRDGTRCVEARQVIPGRQDFGAQHRHAAPCWSPRQLDGFGRDVQVIVQSRRLREFTFAAITANT